MWHRGPPVGSIAVGCSNRTDAVIDVYRRDAKKHYARAVFAVISCPSVCPSARSRRSP